MRPPIEGRFDSTNTASGNTNSEILPQKGDDPWIPAVERPSILSVKYICYSSSLNPDAI